ncbi:MAG: hypothetical protein WBD27_13350 [Pyrinomonadaceae bacterium]
MNLDMVIISIFCMIDDLFKQLGRRIRGRGFAPGLTDAEAVTIETVGELIGLDTDKSIFEYFRRHYSDGSRPFGRCTGRHSCDSRRIFRA